MNPGLDSPRGVRGPVPSAQRRLLVPPQARKDFETLGCKQAMKKFERHTLLVRGGPRGAA